MLLIGMCTSLTKKPTKPMIRKPIIVADAMRANSFLSGFVHFFTRWIESCVVCDVSVSRRRRRRGGGVCVARCASRRGGADGARAFGRRGDDGARGRPARRRPGRVPGAGRRRSGRRRVCVMCPGNARFRRSATCLDELLEGLDDYRVDVRHGRVAAGSLRSLSLLRVSGNCTASSVTASKGQRFDLQLFWLANAALGTE